MDSNASAPCCNIEGTTSPLHANCTACICISMFPALLSMLGSCPQMPYSSSAPGPSVNIKRSPACTSMSTAHEHGDAAHVGRDKHSRCNATYQIHCISEATGRAVDWGRAPRAGMEKLRRSQAYVAPQKAEGGAPATTCTLLEWHSRSRTRNTAKLALSTLAAIVRHSTSSRSPGHPTHLSLGF